jgi:hypothetical protein
MSFLQEVQDRGWKLKSSVAIVVGCANMFANKEKNQEFSKIP